VSRPLVRPLAAEFLGTFLFIFVGCGSVVLNAALNNALGLGGIAFAHALTFAIVVTATMPISGGHINPAITFGSWLAGRIDARKAAMYVGAQLAAAVLAVLVVRWVYPSVAGTATSYGVPRLSGDVSLTHGIVIEAVLTLMLVSAVFGTGVSPHAPRVGGFAIGLTLLPAMLVAGPLTGAALNPARAFGPALVSMDWHGHAVYWLGPLLGAAVAALVWGKVLLPLPGDPEP
jgi:MIP family channel proteins